MDFSKTQVASAAVNHSKLDVSSNHVTTGSFLKLAPVYYRHMLPGEHIKGVGNVLARLAPVAVPTYGRCRINMRAFFVPFRCVFPNFNEFIVDTVASDFENTTLVDSSPTISNSVLVEYFMDEVDQIFLQPLVEEVTDASAIAAGAFDFKYQSKYYRFSYYGRYYHKILQSLGYRVIWNDNKSDDVIFSALPLLCYIKAFMDWYANSAYLNQQMYNDINQLFKFIVPNGHLEIKVAELRKIMGVQSYLIYDSAKDVYISAWDNPIAPNNGLFSSMSALDISFTNQPNNGTIQTSVSGTPFMRQNSATNLYIGSEYLHQMLKAMTDYIKRNQLSGAYQVDRFLARFGINLDSAKVDRSIYVGASSVDIDFGSVMQTSNTSASGSPSNLGDYAGQGLGRGQLEFDFKADEFGLFFVNYSIVPMGHLYQGFDRNLLHLQRTDFYQPEFDNLGCQAISKGEVYVSNDEAFAYDSTDYLAVFGYAPRYYEYKQKSDFVTGDFISPATMIGGEAWHLQRSLKDEQFVPESGSSYRVSGLMHGFEITTGIDAPQYDRIFQYTDSDIDKFYLVFDFKAESLSPCKSLFETYDFEEFGKQLTMDSSGSKVN